MNKKILGIFVSLLVVAMLATPFVGAAQACRWRKPKTVDVYERIPGVPPPTETILPPIPGEDKEFCDGRLVISKGTTVTGTYGSPSDDRGPLGYGTEYAEQIFEITRYSGEIVGTRYEFMSGWGIYKSKIVIDGGPYGEGTLEGYFVVKAEWDLSGSPPRFEKFFTYSLSYGTGDFAGFKVNIEGYWNALMGFPNVWHTKTTVIH